MCIASDRRRRTAANFGLHTAAKIQKCASRPEPQATVDFKKVAIDATENLKRALSKKDESGYTLPIASSAICTLVPRFLLPDFCCHLPVPSKESIDYKTGGMSAVKNNAIFRPSNDALLFNQFTNSVGKSLASDEFLVDPDFDGLKISMEEGYLTPSSTWDIISSLDQIPPTPRPHRECFQLPVPESLLLPKL